MKPMQLGMKVMKVVGKPIRMFFGSDEKGFMTLFAAMVLTYFAGYPDAATIIAVYSAMFGYSGIASMQGSSSVGQGNDGGLDDIEDMMGDALEMAEDFQEQNDNEQVKKE
jgi:hypothetical protein